MFKTRDKCLHSKTKPVFPLLDWTGPKRRHVPRGRQAHVAALRHQHRTRTTHHVRSDLTQWGIPSFPAPLILTWISGDLSTGTKTAGLQGGLLGAARGTVALGPAGCWGTTAAFAPSSGFPAALKPPPEDAPVSSLCSSISSSELLGSSSGSDSELCLLLFAPLMLRMFSGMAAPGSCITLEQNKNMRIRFRSMFSRTSSQTSLLHKPEKSHHPKS